MNNFLIVDNERIICDGMRQALKKAGLFNVFVAYDGIQALSIIKEKNIKAMILDIAMPDMNGVELMKELSRLGLKPVTVIVSGYDEFEYAKEALSYGAIDYILKPLDTDDVIEIGKKMLKLIEQQEIQKQETDKLRKFVLENMESI